MRVNSIFKALVGNRLAVFSAIAITILGFFVVASSFTKRSNRELMAKRVNLTVREIGHHLLLQAGDSTSRVLPVKEIRDRVFLLGFEKELVFNTDSLVTLTQRLIKKAQLPLDYTLTVHECTKPEIVYGFLISASTPSIMPCKGRTQPPGCYAI